MNDLGRQFIQHQEQRLKEVNEQIQDPKQRFKYPSESAIQERVMRIGLEVRSYDVQCGDQWQVTEEMKSVAVATIKEDFIKSINNGLFREKPFR